MPRPPFFGEDTPKVVGFISQISEFHKKKSTQISLKTIVQRVQAEFSGHPIFSRKAVAERKAAAMERARERARKNGQAWNARAWEAKWDEEEALRHIIFKLAKKHKIWFGSEF